MYSLNVPKNMYNDNSQYLYTDYKELSTKRFLTLKWSDSLQNNSTLHETTVLSSAKL